MDDRSDLANLRGKFRELFGKNGLHPVGQGLFWLVVHFHEQAVRANCYSRARKWQYLVAFSRTVAGVNQNWKVAAFFDGGHHRQIQSIARKIRERAHAAFTKHYVVVALG